MPDDIKAMAVRIAMEDSSFQQGVQDLKRQLSEVDSSFKAGVAGVKDWGKNIDNLKSNASSLGKEIEVQKQIVQKYQEQIDKTKKSLQEHSETMMNLKGKVESAKTAWEESKATLGANDEQTKKLKADYEALNEEYKKQEGYVRNNNKTIEGYTIQVNNQTAKLKSLESELSNVNKKVLESQSAWVTAGTALQSGGKKMTTVGEGMSNIGNKLSIGVSLPLLGIGTAATKMAMDAIESENLFEQSMGTMADSTRKWSDKVSKSLGLNAYEVRKNVGTFNVMLLSMGETKEAAQNMSEKMTTLAYDMASFYNMKPEEAFEKLRSGIAGMPKPLEELGIEVKDAQVQQYALAHGIAQTTTNSVAAEKAAVNLEKAQKSYNEAIKQHGANSLDTREKKASLDAAEQSYQKTLQGSNMQLTEAQKVQARYGVILQATNKAQGDLARTIDSPVNKLRVETEQIKQQAIELGQRLIPLAEKGMDILEEVIKWYDGLNDSQKNLIVNMGLIAVVAGPALTVLGKTIGGIGTLTKGIGKLSDGIGKAKVAMDLAKGASEVAGEATVKAAGTAVEAGAAVETATVATEGAATATGGLAATFGTAVLAVAPWIAAIAGVGIGAYALYKYMTNDTIPSVDLFSKKYEENTKVMDRNGQMVDKAVTKTINFSKATKEAVGSYMNMDNNVKKVMTDIYVNSDKFSMQAKNSVINQYTDMTNRVGSLNSNMKDKSIANFKNMITNTGTLTTKNKTEIVKQYSDMVSKVGGLTGQQKQKVIKDFQDTLTNSVGITKQQVTNVTQQFNNMGTQIKTGMDKQTQQQVQTMQQFFTKSSTLSGQEEQKIIQNMQKYNDTKKSQVDSYEKQILQLYQSAYDQHRGLTQNEQQQVNSIQDKMRTEAIKSLSSTETESKVLLEKMKSYGTNITEQQAQSIIQNANKQRDGAIKAANDQYDKVVADIIYQRDVTHQITSDQATKLIADAGKQRDQTIAAAKDQREKVVEHLSKMDSDVLKNMNTDTGNMLSPWEKLKKGITGIFGDIVKAWNDTSFDPKLPTGGRYIGQNRNIVITSGGRGGGGAYASGTDNAKDGIAEVAEDGIELVIGRQFKRFKGGETVLNNKNTMSLLNAKSQSGGNIFNENSNYDFTSSLANANKYGGNLVEAFVSGINSKKGALKSAISNIATSSNNQNDFTKEVSSLIANDIDKNVAQLRQKLFASKPSSDQRSELYKSYENDVNLQYKSTLDNMEVTMSKLSVSTGNLTQDLKNQQEEVAIQSKKTELLKNIWNEMGYMYGYSSEQCLNAKKAMEESDAEAYKLGQTVKDTQEKIGESTKSSINDLFSKVKDALKDYYTEAQKDDEDYWNTQIENNNTWKENTLKNLETVYNTKKNALDDKETQMDAYNSDEDDADKEAELRRELSMHYGAEKKKELQQELNDLIKTRNRRHQKEELEAQKTTLERQYQADQDSVNATAQANEEGYKNQLKTVQNTYAQKLKEGNLDAEAQQLVISDNQDKMVSLLKSYGQDYEIAGASLGDRLVDGFKGKLNTLQDIVSGVVDRINNMGSITSMSIVETSNSGNSINTSSITNAISKALISVKASSSQQIIVPVYLDAKKIAQVTAPYDDKIQGKNLALMQRGL